MLGKKIGLALASLSLVLGPMDVAAAPEVAMRNGSCAQAINVVASFGYGRWTLSCNGAVRSNTWRVHHRNGCFTDVTFHSWGDISSGTRC